MQCQKLQEFEVQSFGLDTGPVSQFATPLLPGQYTLFEVSPDIRTLIMSSRYCCYGNHAAGSKPL